MNKKSHLYKKAIAGYRNIRIVEDNENALFIIKIDETMQSEDCIIENISQNDFQYKIQCIEEINNNEVLIDNVSYQLSYEQYSDTNKTALFSFSWNRNFKGFICIEINKQYLI